MVLPTGHTGTVGAAQPARQATNSLEAGSFGGQSFRVPDERTGSLRLYLKALSRVIDYARPARARYDNWTAAGVMMRESWAMAGRDIHKAMLHVDARRPERSA